MQFRVALAVVFVLTVSVTAYHRLRAAQSGERISHREEGYLFALVLRLAGLGLWMTALAYLLAPALVAWAAVPLPEAVRWAGVLVGLFCSALMWWTLASLGKNLTDTVVTRAAATLVTHGPYRWVRHPFYVTVTFLLASATLISANALLGLLSLFVLALLAVRTPNEEQKLLERFGDQYREYMTRTGRFFPRW